MQKSKAIVVDIDGVILDSDLILKEIYDLKLKGDAMWSYFHSNCNGNRVTFLSNITSLLNSLDSSVTVVLSTSRNECCREGTEKRLHEEGLLYSKLYMRPVNDYRPSSEVKREHLKDIQKSYDVIAFVDDDLSNCQMAKNEGILALRRV